MGRERRERVEDPFLIVLVTPSGPGSGGGTQQVVSRLADLWASEDRPMVLMTTPVDDRWDRLPPSARVIPLHPPDPDAMRSLPALLRSSAGALRSLGIIRRTVREHRGRPVLAFLPGSAILTLVATVGLRPPLIICERNDPRRQRFTPAVRGLRRLLYRRARLVTVNTPVAVEPLQRVVRGRIPVLTVLNPLPTSRPRMTGPRRSHVLSVGRLVPHKRHDDVIRAFATFARRNPDWSLTVIGEGPERSALEALVAELDVADRVTIAGHLPTLEDAFLSASVLVLASEYEGTPNVVLEAVAAGVRCVLSHTVPELPEPLGEDAVAARFRLGDHRGLAEVLERLVADRGRTPVPEDRLAEYALSARASWVTALGVLERTAPGHRNSH